MQELDIREVLVKHFETCVGKSVQIIADPHPLDVEIVSVTPTRYPGQLTPDGRVPFSIKLRTPSSVFIQAGLYPIAFPGIGLIQLHMDPITSMRSGVQDYQIIVC